MKQAILGHRCVCVAGSGEAGEVSVALDAGGGRTVPSAKEV